MPKNEQVTHLGVTFVSARQILRDFFAEKEKKKDYNPKHDVKHFAFDTAFHMPMVLNEIMKLGQDKDHLDAMSTPEKIDHALTKGVAWSDYVKGGYKQGKLVKDAVLVYSALEQLNLKDKPKERWAAKKVELKAAIEAMKSFDPKAAVPKT